MSGALRAGLIAIACILASGGIAPAQPRIEASGGGIAIGGNVSRSTITIGIAPEIVNDLVRERTRPLEELSAQQRTTIALLQEKLILNERQMRAALEIVGEAGIPPEQLAQKLLDIATQFAALRDIAASGPTDDPEVASLKASAQAAIADGDLEAADALLARAEEREAEALREQLKSQAQTKALRGEIALARLHYLDAAGHFGDAARLVAGDDAAREDRLAYLEQEAAALASKGAERGDGEAARAAVERYRTLVELRAGAGPQEEAFARSRLGGALYGAFFRGSDAGDLDDAIAEYQKAAELLDGTGSLLAWAETQGFLGIALSARALAPGRPDAAEEAIAAFERALSTDALPVQDRDALTIGLAQTEAAYSTDPAVRQRAAESVRGVLARSDPNLDPIGTARVHALLASLLFSLGLSTGEASDFEEAGRHFADALAGIPRERLPIEWAVTQGSLGMVLTQIGVRRMDAGRLEEASRAFRAALGEFSPEETPGDWATAQQNLGDALVLLAQMTGRTSHLHDAITTYEETIAVRDRIPALGAMPIDQRLANARSMLGEME